MSKLPSFYAFALVLLMAVPARGQMIQCVDPPSATPSEVACQIAVDSLTHELRLVLQLRAANDTPIPNRPVTFVASSGLIRDADTTNASGYVGVTWKGTVPQEPVVITASASLDGMTTRRQIWLARRKPAVPATPAYITNISPTGGHSAFAGRYLSDDIEVQIQADPSTCNRTKVYFEYLSTGTSSSPAPSKFVAPALWSELDPGQFGCAAQLRWILSPSAGEQTLRAWIERDTAFSAPADQAGVQRYLRPHVVHATAHTLPAFLAGVAIIDSADASVVPKMVGLSLSFPTLADLLKHGKMAGPGAFIDRTRIFVGTEATGQVGKRVYLGFEPLVMLIGPRAADVPVAIATGRRLGPGRDRWFLTGLVNVSNVAGTVATALGFK